MWQNCREEYGEHTCDRRSSRTFIRSKYPQFEIEEGFAEEDELWTPIRESTAHVAIRAREILDRIFNADEEQCALLSPCVPLAGLLLMHESYQSRLMWASSMPFWGLSADKIMNCPLEVYLFFWPFRRGSDYLIGILPVVIKAVIHTT